MMRWHVGNDRTWQAAHTPQDASAELDSAGREQGLPSLRTVTLSLVVLGLAARLVLAYAFYGNFDQTSYDIVASIMERGGNVYAETTRYNYTPVWAYCLLFLNRVALVTGLPFHFVVRGFLSLVDMVNALMIGLIAAQRDPKDGKQRSLLYLLNPVAILLVGCHGQFETLAMLPLLVATYLYARPGGRSPTAWVWLLGTMALVIKHITIFSVWTLFVYAAMTRRAVIMVVGAFAVFVATFLPFLPDGMAGVLANVVRYQSVQNAYGFDLLLPQPIARVLFFSAMLLLPFMAKQYGQLPHANAMELSVVALLTLIYGIGEQYFLLPIIWGSIFASRWYWAYTLVATVFLAGSPNNIDLPYLPALWNTVWLVVTGWLLSYVLTVKPSLKQTATVRTVHGSPSLWEQQAKHATAAEHGTATDAADH